MMHDLTPSEIEALTKAIGNNFSSEDLASTPKSPYDPIESKKFSGTQASISNVQFPQLTEENVRGEEVEKFKEKLKGLDIELDVVLGRAKIPIANLLKLQPGMIMALDKLAGEKVDVEAEGRLIARGEVVVIDENFGVKITEIIET